MGMAWMNAPTNSPNSKSSYSGVAQKLGGNSGHSGFYNTLKAINDSDYLASILDTQAIVIGTAFMASRGFNQAIIDSGYYPATHKKETFQGIVNELSIIGGALDHNLDDMLTVGSQLMAVRAAMINGARTAIS